MVSLITISSTILFWSNGIMEQESRLIFYYYLFGLASGEWSSFKLEVVPFQLKTRSRQLWRATSEAIAGVVLIKERSLFSIIHANIRDPELFKELCSIPSPRGKRD